MDQKMARLIRNITEWMESKQSKVDYIIQFFKGHGCFDAYLTKIQNLGNLTHPYQESEMTR